MLTERIKKHTGLPLSPYFPAAKFSWLLKHVEGAEEKAQKHELCYGTIDTWMIYQLSKEKSYKTDFSNAARTQLFNIFTLTWDEGICEIFGINKEDLPEVCGSDSCFGTTDFEGFFEHQVPIHAVMGDSNGALFGHGELISSPKEVEPLCKKVEQNDELYFVPAFTGLGAPYWNSHVKGELSGIGAAYLAGIALGIYDKTIFDQIKCDKYELLMEEERWKHKKYGWKKIIQSACEKN